MDLGEKFLETVFLSQVQEVWSSLARCCLAKQMVGNLRPSFLNVEKKKNVKNRWLATFQLQKVKFAFFDLFFLPVTFEALDNRELKKAPWSPGTMLWWILFYS